MSVDPRKIATGLEEIWHDRGPRLDFPVRKAWVAALIKNPFAGRCEPEIAGFMEDLKPLGLDCSKRLISILGGDPSVVEAYGKGSLVGSDGEIEHGALWHVPGGYAMRELLGRGPRHSALLGQDRSDRRVHRRPDPPQERLLRAQSL